LQTDQNPGPGYQPDKFVVSVKQCVALTIEYLNSCQKVAEFLSGQEGGNIIKQRFQKFLLQGDAFAIDSMLQLLSEVIQPALTEGRYSSFLSFATEMENRDKVLAGMIDSKLTSRDS